MDILKRTVQFGHARITLGSKKKLACEDTCLSSREGETLLSSVAGVGSPFLRGAVTQSGKDRGGSPLLYLIPSR